MQQTEQTAIVLRSANYRDNDRMLTLFSPTRGRLEVLSRGCRRPRSPLLAASEVFALGDFELYTKGNHLSLVGARLIETFYPLRNDFDRLACGTYLLNLCEEAIQPGQNAQELFMLLLHTLSRLTFSDQAWRPLLSGFLLHYSGIEGFKPRLNHCVRCGRAFADEEDAFFDADGGLCCDACHKRDLAEDALRRIPQIHRFPVSAAQCRWMRHALTVGSSRWLDAEDTPAPYPLLRRYVETHLDAPVRSASMLPKD